MQDGTTVQQEADDVPVGHQGGPPLYGRMMNAIRGEFMHCASYGSFSSFNRIYHPTCFFCIPSSKFLQAYGFA